MKLFVRGLFCVLLASGFLTGCFSTPNPVPVTGQTFGVLLSAAAVGPVRGLAGQLLYVVLGWIGLPVFAFRQYTSLSRPPSTTRSPDAAADE